MRVSGAALALVFNLVLARYLGADGAGVYLLALTVVTVGTVVSRLGLDNVLVRFVATYKALDDWASVRGVHRTALRTSGVVAAATTALLVAGAPFLSSTLFGKPELTLPLQLLSLAILPMTVALLQGEALKGIERIVPSQFIHWVMLPACLLLMSWVVLPRWGPAGGAAAYVISACCTAGLSGTLWRRSVRRTTRATRSYPTGELLRVSTPLMWATSLNMVMTWVGMVTLGVFASTSEVGVFGVASRLSVLVGFGVVAVNSVASPRFAALHAQGRTGELRRMVALTGGVMALAAGPVVVAVLILAEPILTLFGPEFVGGATPLRLLCLGQAALVATGPATPLLMMTGHESQVRNAIGIAAVVAVLLNAALVPDFGVVGAAVASGVALPLVNVIAAFQAWRLTGVLTVPGPSLQGLGI